MHCVVSISRRRAAIEVENPAFVPQTFLLVWANEPSIVHECRIAWIKQKRIGLTFLERRRVFYLTRFLYANRHPLRSKTPYRFNNGFRPVLEFSNDSAP